MRVKSSSSSLERLHEADPLAELALELLLVLALQWHHERLRSEPQRILNHQDRHVTLVSGLILGLRPGHHGLETADVRPADVLGQVVESGHGFESVRARACG
jgi:hypothetical protein